MKLPANEPSSLPWFREELRNKMAALEQEIAGHRHTLDLLRQTEWAYGRFVPSKMLGLLDVQSILDLRLGDQTEKHMTVLFTDIRGFSQLSESMSPQQTFAFINSFFGEMEPVISQHGGIVDKYIGDAIMAIFPSGADAGLRCAIAMLEQLGRYNAGRVRAGYGPIDIGIGLNAGLVMLGVIGGTQRMEGTVVSDAVNLTSRIEDTTKIYRTPLLVSETLLSDLNDPSIYRIRFLDRIRVKGKTRPQSVYEVFDGDSEQTGAGKERTRSRFEQAVAYYHLKDVQKAIPLLETCVQEVPDDYPARLYLDRCREFLKSGRHEGTGEISANLEWSDELVLGVPEIDEEHQQLVANMNSLGHAIKNGELTAVGQTLAFLEEYARFHFDNEENAMQAAGYPMLDSHIKEHRSFSARLANLKRDITSGLHDSRYLAFQVQLFLIDWLANHIVRTDRHLANFLHYRAHEVAT